MTGEACEATGAREALDALRRLTRLRRDSTACEAEPDAAALDDLARLAEHLGRAVEEVTGARSEAVKACAGQLAEAIAPRPADR